MRYLKFILVIIGFLIAVSFVTVQKDKGQLVQEALIKRIDDYKSDQLAKCYKKAMEEAEVTVDSIIAIELGAGPIDTSDFPRKPIKPSFEAYDSLKQRDIDIKPLFDSTEIKQQN